MDARTGGEFGFEQLRKTHSSYQILPTGIGSKSIKHRHCQFDDSKHPLLVCVPEAFEGRSQVAESGINDRKIEWGNVLLPRQRLQFLENVDCLFRLTDQSARPSQESPEVRPPGKVHRDLQFCDGLGKIAFLF